MAFRVSSWRRFMPLVALFAALLFGWWNWNSLQPSGNDLRACGPPGEQSLSSSTDDKQREMPSTEPMVGRGAVDSAFGFLDAQMDLHHKTITVRSGSGVAAYYPSGMIGDVGDITVEPEFRPSSHSGRSSLRIQYRPAPSGGQDWAGVYFLYPDHNWGQFAGRDLTGATRLTFWVCADRNTRAEFLVGGIREPGLPHFDSLPKAS